MNINGNWFNIARLKEETLYSSPYLVATHQGYTKHYYEGSERIASCIGQGGLSIIDQPLTIESNENWTIKKSILNHQMGTVFGDCLNKMFDVKENGLSNLYDLTEAHTAIMEQYFYHPDHLGSTSWITDGSGNAIQYMHYLPYGEAWIDQQSTSWNAPYTFTGKIKDAETGYNYFGARYYDSQLSVWLSVDPMSDKYPSLSPYTYCANNPIMMVDPDGRFVIDPSIKKISTYLYKYLTTQLQKDIIGNKLIMKGLMYFGDMTEEQIIEKTTNGKGPRIMFTTDEISKYNYRNDEGDILLSNSSKVRSSIFNDKNGSDYDKNLVLFDIFQTILHEFVHYGQQRLGAGEERKNLPQHRLIIDGVVSNQFKNPKFDIGFLFASMVFHNSDWSKTVETFEDSKEAFDRFNQLPDNVEKPLPTLIK